MRVIGHAVRGTAALLVLITVSLSGCATGPDYPTAEKFVESREVMSTVATVTLIASGSKQAAAAAEAVFAALDSVDAGMNYYAEDGELARINRGAHSGPVPVSAATLAVLQHAAELAALSEGAFDVTVGPLIQLWKECARAERLPTATELDTARAGVGYQKIILDPEASTVRFADAGMSIDLGGIAKGYAIDRAVAAAQRAGVTAGIVEVGGDLRCFGAIPAGLIGRAAELPVRTLRRRAAGEGTLRDPGDEAASPAGHFPGLRRTEPAPRVDPQPWPLGVQSPFSEGLLGKIRVPGAAVATSGHYRRHITIAGRRYSHIVDPRDGQPVDAPVSVTVIAPDAMTADALATAISVLGADEGLALAESLPEVAALVVIGDEAAYELRASSGFPEVEPLDPGSGK